MGQLDDDVEWATLYKEFKKFPKTTNSAAERLRIIMKLFVVDFNQSMNKRLDMIYWGILSTTISTMRENTDEKTVLNNLYNLSIGFINDLVLTVHLNYEMPSIGLPEYMICAPGKSTRKIERKTSAMVFCATMLLRMGDLMRYKNDIGMAKQFYEKSVGMNPADGAAWNQLGVVSFKSGKWLDSLYHHSRALYSTIAFPTATTNLSSIFKKFASKDLEKCHIESEFYVNLISKIHFQQKIECKVIEKIQPLYSNLNKIIIPLMAEYENLEGGTEKEDAAISTIRLVWEDLYEHLVDVLLNDITDSNTQLLMLLLREPLFCKINEKAHRLSAELDKFADQTIADSKRYYHFRCLKSNTLPFPLKYGELSHILIDDTRLEKSTLRKEKDELAVDDRCESSSSSSPTPEKGRIAVETSKCVSDEEDDSDEELLMAATRRRPRFEDGDKRQIDDDDEDEDEDEDEDDDDDF